jgi:hypothetical protein
MKLTKLTLSLLAFSAVSSNAAIIWGLGDPTTPGRAVTEPAELYGAAFTVDFRQETAVNPLPGDPNSPSVDRQADDD